MSRRHEGGAWRRFLRGQKTVDLRSRFSVDWLLNLVILVNMYISPIVLTGVRPMYFRRECDKQWFSLWEGPGVADGRARVDLLRGPMAELPSNFRQREVHAHRASVCRDDFYDNTWLSVMALLITVLSVMLLFGESAVEAYGEAMLACSLRGLACFSEHCA